VSLAALPLAAACQHVAAPVGQAGPDLVAPQTEFRLAAPEFDVTSPTMGEAQDGDGYVAYLPPDSVNGLSGRVMLAYFRTTEGAPDAPAFTPPELRKLCERLKAALVAEGDGAPTNVDFGAGLIRLGEAASGKAERRLHAVWRADQDCGTN
jgi:hypothetical protein